MSSETASFRIEEYRALRATIRERGTARGFVVLITIVSWAAALLAVQSLFVVPLLTLVPLAILAAGFEVSFAMHVGVERIGRYLQVAYEDALTGPDGPRWETTAMRLSPGAGPGSGIDPLYSWPFFACGLLNVVPVAIMTILPGDTVDFRPSQDFVFLALPHAVWLFRLYLARRYATGQRARDLSSFREAQKNTP